MIYINKKTIDDYLISGDTLYQTIFGNITFPLGTYAVQETKAPTGYLLNEEVFVKNITSDSTNEAVSTYNAPTIPEQIKRGDFEFDKKAFDTQRSMANVEFTITSKTTGESHSIVTDENGYYSTESSYNKHTNNTNQGKTSEDGVWFGDTTPNDNLGALPYDTYILKEVKSSANKGYKLIEKEFTISRDGYTVKGGTINDEKLPAKALDSIAEGIEVIGDTLDKISITTENWTKTQTFEETIGDTIVKITMTVNLIYDESTETVSPEAVVDSYVIVDRMGAVIDNAMVIIDFIIDEQTTTINEDGELVLNGDLVVSESKLLKEIVPSHSTTISDSIEYKNAEVDSEYTIKGELVCADCTSQSDIDSGNYTPLATDEYTFTAEGESQLTDGQAMLVFEDVDTLKHQGHSLVVIDKMYDTVDMDEPVAIHTDLSDKDQTVDVLKIKLSSKATTFEGEKDVIPSKESKLIDTLSYENLEKGKEYTVVGEFYCHDCKGVIGNSTATFTAENNSGSATVEYTIDTLNHQGHSLVALDTLYLTDDYKADGDFIAEHKDKDDKDQTVEIKYLEGTITIGDTPTIDGGNSFVETSDRYNVAGLILISTLALLGCGITLSRIKKEK